jgi:HK97 family phage major capsid protein
MRLAKDDNNQYYGGGPFSGPYGNGAYANAERYWGLPVVVTTAITSGTALVGAFKLGAQIWDREGITVDATNSDQDDFTFNRMAIRVEERLALAIYRPNAFCKVTGI